MQSRRPSPSRCIRIVQLRGQHARFDRSRQSRSRENAKELEKKATIIEDIYETVFRRLI